MNKQTMLVAMMAFLLVGMAYAQGSFIVANITNTSKAYFIINGTTGKIGVGTPALDSILKVNGSINITDTVWANGINLSTLGGGSGTIFNRENISEYLGGSDANASLVKLGNLSTILAPYQYEASAFKNANATALIGNNESNSLWNKSGSDIFLREITSRVGMGTNSPSAALHILKNDTNNFSTTNVLVLEHALANPLNSTGGLGVGVLFRGIDNGSNTDDIALVNATLVSSLNGSESSSLGFYTRTGGNAPSLAMILNGSNVGIGTSSPDKRLVVIGSVNISDALNVSGTVQAARFIGDGSALSNIDSSVADEFNYVNLTGILGDNASILRVANLSLLDGSIADDFNLVNLTEFLGGNNGTLVRFSNISGYDTSTADEFTKSNYSSEYASTGFDRTNVTEFLGGSSVNASLIKIGNVSGWDLSVTDEFTKANYSTEYASTGFKRGNVTEYLGGSSVNASLIKIGNVSGWDLSVTDEFTKANYSTEYASTGFDRENVSEYLGGSSVNASLITASNLTALYGTNASNSLWNQTTAAIFQRDESKNVGMGTANPTKKLSVNGTLSALTIDPSALNPTINTTGGRKNITVASEDGSVIIQLG